MIEIELDVNEYMSITEAATYLGVKRQRVYQLIQEGRLTEIKFGQTRVVLTSEVDAIRVGHEKFKHFKDKSDN